MNNILALDKAVDMLMTGAVDTHIHGSPDIVLRKKSDLEVAQAAKKAGMRGIVLKSHVTTTTSRASLTQEAVGDFQVFGGLVLNKPAGGLNPAAVEVELYLGAKIIWMPTISSICHVLVDGGNLKKAVPIRDEKGDFYPELYDILDLIAANDVVLGTGHLEADEIEALITLAKTRKVEKIIINHPESRMPRMPIDMQRRLAQQGVFFERCFYALNPPANVDPMAIAEQIKATGVEYSIMATDFGQVFNDEPVQGLRRYIGLMLECGVTVSDIEMMVKKNPALLLGL